MTRLALILASLLALAACDKSSEQSVNTAIATVLGHAEPGIETVAYTNVVPSSEEPAPALACDDYLNRGRWYDCHGNYLRDMD